MYDVGDVVPLGLSITDANGAPGDATTVVLTVGLPDGTSVTPSVDHVTGSGEYTVDYVTTMEGLHTVAWAATGVNETSYHDVFNVRELTDQILSLTAAKQQLGLTTDAHDDELRTFIAAAGRAIEDHTAKTVVRRSHTEKHYRVCGKIFLDHSPVLSTTSVSTVDGVTTWDVDDLDVDSTTGIVRATTGPILYGNLTVTYLAGMRVIPANILLAARIITEHLWQTMRPFSSAAAVLVPGALEDSLDARSGGLVGFAIPNRALELLGKPPPMVA